jgi:hypothetical protein
VRPRGAARDDDRIEGLIPTIVRVDRSEPRRARCTIARGFATAIELIEKERRRADGAQCPRKLHRRIWREA